MEDLDKLKAEANAAILEQEAADRASEQAATEAAQLKQYLQLKALMAEEARLNAINTNIGIMALGMDIYLRSREQPPPIVLPPPRLPVTCRELGYGVTRCY